MYEYFACMCMYTTCTLYPQRLKRVSDHLELVLRMVVGHSVDTGNRNRSFARAVSAFND